MLTWLLLFLEKRHYDSQTAHYQLHTAPSNDCHSLVVTTTTTIMAFLHPLSFTDFRSCDTFLRNGPWARFTRHFYSPLPSIHYSLFLYRIYSFHTLFFIINARLSLDTNSQIVQVSLTQNSTYDS